jgi:hypothetical protein
MNLHDLKSNLMATKPWHLYFIKQGSALKGLLVSRDPGAAEVLVEAVDSGHRLSSKIKPALAAVTDAGWIDRLCCLWAKQRQGWLGELVKAMKWTSSEPGVSVLCALKSGLQKRLGTDSQTVTAVLAHIGDEDEDLKAGAVAYAARLPDEARCNDALYDMWFRTQSTELREVITGQQRLPSSVAKETLLRLSIGDADGYLALDDENGQIFREAWGLASDPLRQLLVGTVTKSGNSRLIDAYTKALGGELDPATELELRKTAGDEDGLLETCRTLKIFDLLDQCARWEETGTRPEDPSRKRAVENALVAWREVGEIEYDEAPELPEGLVDFFDAELDSSLDSPDPLMRLHASVNGKGSPNPQDWIKSKAWPERLAARLLDPSLAGEPDHVEWTGGVISNALLVTTAEGTPAEHETLLGLREANAGRGDRASVINRGLAGVLLAFQSHFQRGAITTEDDDSAEDQAAIQVGGAASAEDMVF